MNYKAIEDLIHVLDQRKDEAIERTFEQVAKFFSKVWEKLVPQGHGSLIMVRKADHVSSFIILFRSYSFCRLLTMI